jgi:hypothetical protein
VCEIAAITVVAVEANVELIATILISLNFGQGKKEGSSIKNRKLAPIAINSLSLLVQGPIGSDAYSNYACKAINTSVE